MVQRGGDGLVLEVHLGKAHGTRSGLQRRLRARVALGVVVDEEDRPAQHDAVDGRAGLGLGQLLEPPQIAGDDVAVAHGAAAADVGALVEQRGAEDALHRPHEAAFGTFDIGCQRGAAVQALGFQLMGRRIGAVEHRGGHGGESGLQRHQADTA